MECAGARLVSRGTDSILQNQFEMDEEKLLVNYQQKAHQVSQNFRLHVFKSYEFHKCRWVGGLDIISFIF